jgi:uncharacterized protein (TIGR03067 family)
MRSIILSLFAGLLLVSGFAGCTPAKEESKTAGTAATTSGDDMKKCEGTWTLVSGEADGTPLPEDEIKNSTLVIAGDAYTVTLKGEGVKKGTQKLDPTKTPKQIDAQDTSGPTVGKNLGIYEFLANGDFRVCFGAPGKDRPTEFATKPGSGHFMHVWHRATAN